MCLILFQLLSKNKQKSILDNVKEISPSECLCFQFIKFMQLVEKNETLIDEKTFYALSKIHLDRYGVCLFFLQIFAYTLLRYKFKSWACAADNENLPHILFYYNLNSFIENVSRNGWELFKNSKMHFICININNRLPKID